MPAAAPSSPGPDCSLLAIFVVFNAVLVMLALVVDVLVAPLADEPLIVNVPAAPLANEPPVAEEVEVLRANIAEILLACAASIFAPHGLLGPGVPSCGHPVRFLQPRSGVNGCPVQPQRLRNAGFVLQPRRCLSLADNALSLSLVTVQRLLLLVQIRTGSNIV
jgi:hypothetical protein